MYSPKIKPELVKELYNLKQTKKKPMTKMVNEAVREYLIKNNNQRGQYECNYKNICKNHNHNSENSSWRV